MNDIAMTLANWRQVPRYKYVVGHMAKFFGYFILYIIHGLCNFDILRYLVYNIKHISTL